MFIFVGLGVHFGRFIFKITKPLSGGIPPHLLPSLAHLRMYVASLKEYVKIIYTEYNFVADYDRVRDTTIHMSMHNIYTYIYDSY